MEDVIKLSKGSIEFLLKLIDKNCKRNICTDSCVNYDSCTKEKWDMVRRQLEEQNIKLDDYIS